jgi:hypothetical protein
MVTWGRLMAALFLSSSSVSSAGNPPKRDGGHGFPCSVLAIRTQLKKGHRHEKDNLGSGLRHHYRSGTDNGIWVRSSPIAFDLSRWPRVFLDVIDYFAMGVLVLIALLAVARLFPPPDRAQ